jgi:hypothetical protein
MIEINIDLKGEAVYTVTPAMPADDAPARTEDCPYCEDECNQTCKEE